MSGMGEGKTRHDAYYLVIYCYECLTYLLQLQIPGSNGEVNQHSRVIGNGGAYSGAGQLFRSHSASHSGAIRPIKGVLSPHEEHLPTVQTTL